MTTKTQVRIPDELLHAAGVLAAVKGQSKNSFIVDAIAEKIAHESEHAADRTARLMASAATWPTVSERGSKSANDNGGSA